MSDHWSSGKNTTKMTAPMENDKVTIVELNNLYNVPNPLKRKDILEVSDSTREKRWSIYPEQEQYMHQEYKQDVRTERYTHQDNDNLKQDWHLEHNIHKEQERYYSNQTPGCTSNVNFELFNKTEKAWTDTPFPPKNFLPTPPPPFGDQSSHTNFLPTPPPPFGDQSYQSFKNDFYVEHAPSNPKPESTQTLISKSKHSIHICEGNCPFIITVSNNLTAEDIWFLKQVQQQIQARANKANREQAVITASNRLNFEHFYKIKQESEHIFKCDFYIDHFLVSSVTAPTEEKARSKSVNVAIDNLQKSLRNPKNEKKLERKKILKKNQHDVQEQEFRLRAAELTPGVSYDVGENVNTAELGASNKEDLKCKFLAKSFPQRFVLVYHSETGTPEKILQDSADFSDLKLNFRYENKIKGCKLRLCSAIIDGEVCGVATGNKGSAKTDAAKAALAFLKTFIYSIKVKNNQGHSGFEITRDQLRGSSIAKALPNDNIGAKMMKMMGWTGGSIGKVGSSGIIEPIWFVSTKVHREGLGFTDNKRDLQTFNFNGAAFDLIRNYAQSDTLDDLIFSNEFSDEEKSIIRGIARKLKLITDGKGRKDPSHVVISRRSQVETLLNHLRQVGGSTSKYELISPPTVNVGETSQINKPVYTGTTNMI